MFFGSKVPDEVVTALPALHAMSNLDIGTLVSCSIRGVDDAQRQDALALSPEHGIVFTALDKILSVAVRTRTKAGQVENDLKELNFPAEAIPLIVEGLKKSRHELESRSLSIRTRFPRLDALKWRVDVTISSSSLLRVFRPNVMMQMTLSDGRIKTFDVPFEQFHQLRYNVAKVLREMQELERHPIMRIADEAAKKTFEE